MLTELVAAAAVAEHVLVEAREQMHLRAAGARRLSGGLGCPDAEPVVFALVLRPVERRGDLVDRSADFGLRDSRPASKVGHGREPMTRGVSRGKVREHLLARDRGVEGASLRGNPFVEERERIPLALQRAEDRTQADTEEPGGSRLRAPCSHPGLRSCETRLLQGYFQTTVTVLEADPRYVAVAEYCTLK